MRALVFAAAAVVASCTTPQPNPAESAEAREALSQRVNAICALPPSEREAELVKLKEETGLALVCADPKPTTAEAPQN
jgi:hypothetical protein